MPKLTNRPPRYKQSGKYAVIYVDGKRIFLGLFPWVEVRLAWGSVIKGRKNC